MASAAYRQAGNLYRELAHQAAAPAEDEAAGIDWAALRAVNGDVIAWLSCDGTPLDYPIVQTQDNSFYLRHLLDGSPNPAGTLFVDYRNAGDFTDQNTVIYGHNMKDKSMFGSLLGYRDQEYWAAHPSLTLHIGDACYELQVAAAFVRNVDGYDVPFSFESDEEYLAYLQQARQFPAGAGAAEPAPGDRLVTLCCCPDENAKHERFFVVARLVTRPGAAPSGAGGAG